MTAAGAGPSRLAGRVLLAVLAVGLVAGAFAVTADPGPSREVAAASPVAPAPYLDGFVVGERLTGRILSVADPARPDRAEVLDRLDVVGAPDDQRGLLGLVAIRGELFAAWTRASDGRLVVGRIVPGEAPRLVWEGPVSADRANGGHLAVHPLTGELVIGIGDLLDAERVGDPDAPNGKLLALDPAQPPDQVPTVLSAGWNNPFAFTFVAGARLVVADNAGPSGAERLGLAEPEPVVLTELTPAGGAQLAPSALVVLPDGDLGLCGYVARTLERLTWEDGPDGTTVGRPGTPAVDEPCATGAAVLADGALVLTTDTGYLVVPA